MNDESNLNANRSFLTGDTVREIPSGNGTMVVGVSNRLSGVFTHDEEECEVPEDFESDTNDYDGWLGVD